MEAQAKWDWLTCPFCGEVSYPEIMEDWLGDLDSWKCIICGCIFYTESEDNKYVKI